MKHDKTPKSAAKPVASPVEDFGRKNPYASDVVDTGLTEDDERAIGRFISRWTALEGAVRDVLRLRKRQIASAVISPPLWRETLLQAARLNADQQRDLDEIRRLRNELVHGVERPSNSRLLRAADDLERLLHRWAEESDGEEAAILNAALAKLSGGGG